jgi:metal-responsive CopG/Arc/MetJ family transcriptional regulator
METISFRLEKDFAKELARIIANNMYSTKTEFVREAIRDKIKQIQKEELLKKVAVLSGSSKKKTTDEELYKAGERAFKRLEKKFKAATH